MAANGIPKTKDEAREAFALTEPATLTSRGTVLQGASVADAAGAAPTAAEFDALLASLRAAGVIAEEE